MNDELKDGTLLDRAALAQLREMTGDDPDFFMEMIDTFLRDGLQLVARMQAAEAAGDTDALRRAAHTLKSNCRTFGAMDLADQCEAIERRAGDGGVEGLNALVGEAARSYRPVVVALERERPAT